MIVDISNTLVSILNWIREGFAGFTSFLSSIPRFVTYLTDMSDQMPTFLVGTCASLLSIAVVNKILSIHR